jgi:hypothetical protein
MLTGGAASAAAVSSWSNSSGLRRLAHVPFDVVCQQAHEHVGPRVIGSPVMNGAHVTLHGLQAAKGPLDLS